MQDWTGLASWRLATGDRGQIRQGKESKASTPDVVGLTCLTMPDRVSGSLPGLSTVHSSRLSWAQNDGAGGATFVRRGIRRTCRTRSESLDHGHARIQHRAAAHRTAPHRTDIHLGSVRICMTTDVRPVFAGRLICMLAAPDLLSGARTADAVLRILQVLSWPP